MEIFSLPVSRICVKIHHINRCSFLYILAKLHPKIIENKQDTAKSLVYNLSVLSAANMYKANIHEY